jgi:hypothetical protein
LNPILLNRLGDSPNDMSYRWVIEELAQANSSKSTKVPVPSATKVETPRVPGASWSLAPPRDGDSPHAPCERRGDAVTEAPPWVQSR